MSYMVIEGGKKAGQEHVSIAATNNIPKVCPGVDIVEAAKIMARHRARVVPVVQDGKFVEFLTLEDLMVETPTLAVMAAQHWGISEGRKGRERGNVH